MPFSSDGKTEDVATLFKPKPRASNSTQRQIIGDNHFVTPKKRRRLERGNKSELDKLFDKISNDPFYENDLPLYDDKPTSSPKEEQVDSKELLLEQQLKWLYDDPSHDNDDSTSVYDLAALATSFLEEEQTEQLKLALDGTDLTKISTPIYRFFNNRCKLPIPHLQVETGSIIDESNKAKYDRIIKYSHSKEQRKFFLSCGLLPLWHKQGWHCPQSVYRWLMEIVAFDKDIETARKAKTIVYALWSKMPREKLCMQPTTGDDINYSRFMSLETFNYILKGYGALDLSTMDDDTDTLMEKDDLTDKIPLTQFEWTLQLLQRSLDLWPEAYTNQQIHSLATTLICMGIDGIGVLALKHIQDTLDTCLSVFTEDTWRLQLQQLAYHLIERFTSIELRVRLPTVTKTIYPRSLYLRRVMAVMSLEAALYKDKMDERELTFGDVSLSLAFDNELIPRLAAIVDDSGGIFQQTDPDYCQISDRIYLLDYAVGNDYAELMASIDAVNSIVTQLQAFSRKIGGTLGALAKTKANEVAQRLWSRLVYVIGQNRNPEEYNEL